MAGLGKTLPVGVDSVGPGLGRQEGSTPVVWGTLDSRVG